MGDALDDFEDMVDSMMIVTLKEETKMTEQKLNLEFYVAGVKFRKDWKKNLEALHEDDVLCLAREPENRFDPFAVQILYYHDAATLDESGMMLGYVPAKTGEAKVVSEALKEGRGLIATVVEVSPDFEPWTALKVRITAPEFMSDEEEEVDMTPTTGSPEDEESDETETHFEPWEEE